MIPHDFSGFFRGLAPSRRQQVVDELPSMISSPIGDGASLLEDAKSVRPTGCPHCGSGEIRGNGKHKGVRRHHCKGCGKYFRDSTGKLVFALKKPELFPDCPYRMLMGLSIEKFARRTGICVRTSFDRRHKVLGAFEEACPEGFRGIAESDDIFFLESARGRKNPGRKPRKRGGKAGRRGIGDERVAVVATHDRSGNTELRVAAKGRVSRKDLQRVFGEKLDGVDVLCTDAHRSYAAFSKSRKTNRQTVSVSKGQRIKNRVCHIQNVNNMAARLRKWMRAFNGVATKYLQNYLNWFMVLERVKNRGQRLRAFANYAFAVQSAWEFWKNLPKSAIF